MKKSFSNNVFIISCFYFWVALICLAIWFFSLPEAVLIVCTIPVIIAAMVMPRYVYMSMAIGMLLVSVYTLQNVMPNGISVENIYTVTAVSVAVISISEITYRVLNTLKRTQKRLRYSESRFRLLIENSPDAVIVYIEEKIHFMNPAAAEMLGTDDKNDLYGQNGLELVHPEDQKTVQKQFLKLLQGNPQEEFSEFRMMRRDGGVIEVEAIGMPIIFDEEPGLQVTIRDVTLRNKEIRERQILEVQMLETQKLESLAVLSGGIAHEFNNILVGIKGNAQFLLGSIAEEDPKRKNYQTIIDAADRATGLCSLMRSYSGDDQPHHMAFINLSSELSELGKIIEILGGDHIALKLDLDDDMPLLKLDPTQLKQVFVALVTNAVEAIGTAKGIITVQTGFKKCDSNFLKKSMINDDLEEGSYIYLSVTDNGCGIPEDVITNIFDPFFTTKFAGRGLGLAAVHGIMRTIKGDLRVESIAGEGSVFTAYFPAFKELQKNNDSAFSYTPQVNFQGEGTAIIIENDDSVKRYLTQVLERAGFNVEVLTSFDDYPGNIENANIVFIDDLELINNLPESIKFCPVIYLADSKSSDKIQNISSKNILKKPFKRKEVLVLLQKLIGN